MLRWICSILLLIASAAAVARAQVLPREATSIEAAKVADELRGLASEMAGVDALLKELSSSEYAAREGATKRLMELPLLPVQRLETRSIDADPETRFRIRQILSRPTPPTARLTELVAAVHEQKIPGLTKELLTILEFSGDAKLSWSFEQALLSTSREADVALLAAALQSRAPAVRIASLNALTALRTAAAVEALLSHRNETDEHAQLAQGEGLVKVGRQEGLEMLIALLTSRDPEVRTRAAIDLQSVTGRSLASSPADATERDRQANAAAWRAWIAGQPSLRLRPLEATNTSVSPFDD